MPEDIKPPFSLESVSFAPDGLVPVVAQDAEGGKVLMLAYANREALERTLATGRAHYWSRSRAELWEKGAGSGNTQAVRAVTLDCDGDAVLYTVAASGPACHTGDESCFHNPVTVFPLPLEGGGREGVARAEPEAGPSDGNSPRPVDHSSRPSPAAGARLGDVLEHVYGVIRDRVERQPEGSYVAKLHNAGLDRVLKKVGEEAGEVIIAAKNRSREELTLEAADLLFHTFFALYEVGVTPAEVARELEARHASRPRGE